MKWISLLVFFLLAVPARAEAPEDFTGWKKLVQGRYPAKVWASPRQGGCYGKPGLEKGFRALFGAWGLRANVKPENNKLFARIGLGIFPLKDKADPAAFLMKVAAEQKNPPMCFVAKSAHLQFAWEGFWIEMTCPCSAGKMVYYEAGDLFDWLEGMQADSLPEQVFFSYCGSMELRQVKTAWLKSQASKTRTFWGRKFPAARREAKVKTLRGVAKNAKAGAVLLVDGSDMVVYLEGLSEWPEALLDQRVEARGRLVEEKFIPDPGPDEHGAYSQGAEGAQTVLKTPTYKRLP